MVSVCIDKTRNDVLVTTTKNDGELLSYLDKIVFVPYIYPDGEIVLKFMYMDDNIDNSINLEIKGHSSLFRNINHDIFYRTIVKIIQTNNNFKQNIVNYLNELKDNHIQFDSLEPKTCPCCNTFIFTLGNSEYCVNSQCSMFNYHESLVKQLMILGFDMKDISYIIQLADQYANNNNIPIRSLSNLDMLFLLKLTINNNDDVEMKYRIQSILQSLTIFTLFKLFKIPTVLFEDVYKFCETSYVNIIQNPYKLFTFIDTIERCIVENEPIYHDEDVDRYIKSSVFINKGTILELGNLLEKLQNLY